MEDVVSQDQWVAAGGLMIPVFGNAIAAEELMNPMAKAFKKKLADAAMNAATKAGASYCDVRVGRYESVHYHP